MQNDACPRWNWEVNEYSLPLYQLHIKASLTPPTKKGVRVRPVAGQLSHRNYKGNFWFTCSLAEIAFAKCGTCRGEEIHG